MTLRELIALLVGLGGVVSAEGGGLTELDHAVQCASALRLGRPDDLELQVAGLVHDVGHHFGDDEAHGRLGAAAVRPVLGPRVAALVEAHVPAKRFLVSVDPGYALSSVSAATLTDQGGAFSPAQCRAFAARPWSADAVALRRADDGAKVPGAVAALDGWIAVLEEVALLASGTLRP